MRLRLLAPFTLSLLALASSCGSEPTPPTGTPSTLSFTYSGFRSGTYSVTGFRPDPRTGTVYSTPWAAADLFQLERVYARVSSSLPANANNHLAQLVIPAGITGTFQLGVAHADSVIYDGLTFEFNPTSTTARESYLMFPGTVTVTSTTADRVVGTFSGTAVDSVHANHTITVTNGSFDVFVGQP